MEGRIVGSQDTAVKVGTLFVLFLDCTDMTVFYNLYGQYVLAGHNAICDIHFTTDKCTFNVTKLFAVKIDMSFPVDAVEIEENPFFDERFGYFKLISVPEAGIEKSLGDIKLVIRIIGVGYSTHIPVTGQDRSRYGSGNPTIRQEC